jgi:hypothetical protein
MVRDVVKEIYGFEFIPLIIYKRKLLGGLNFLKENKDFTFE